MQTLLYLRLKDGTKIYDKGIYCIAENLENLKPRDGYSWTQVTSLDDYSKEEETLPLPRPTPQSVLKELEQWAASKGEDWAWRWRTEIAFIKNAFLWWSDTDNTAADKDYVKAATNKLLEVDGVNPLEVAYILNKIDEVG